MVLALLCILLLACGDAKSAAGGSGTETEATMTGVVLAEGRPVASARILLRNGNVSNSAVQDSTRSDSQGRWNLGAVPAGAWSLEVRSLEEGAALAEWSRITVAEGWPAPALRTTYLRPLNRLQGWLLNRAGLPVSGVWLKVLGRGDSTQTDAAGFYQVDSLPPGAHWLEVNGNVLPTRTGIPDTLRLDGSLRLEDFEDDSHDMAVEAGRWNGKGGWWYALQNDSSLSVLPLLTEDPDMAGNHLLHARFAIPRGKWALVGFMAYADTASPENWCSVRTLQFRARGEGTLRVQVQTATTLHPEKEKHFDATLKLTSDWNVHPVILDSLRQANGLKWQKSCHDVRFVNFVANDTLELWLDDIVLR